MIYLLTLPIFPVKRETLREPSAATPRAVRVLPFRELKTGSSLRTARHNPFRPDRPNFQCQDRDTDSPAMRVAVSPWGVTAPAPGRPS